VFLLSPHSLGLVDYFSSFFFNLLFGRFRILDRYLHRSSKSTTLLIMMRLLLLSTNRTNTRESDIIVDVVVVVFYSSRMYHHFVLYTLLFFFSSCFDETVYKRERETRMRNSSSHVRCSQLRRCSCQPLCCCQPLCHCAVVIVPTAGCGTCLLPYKTLTLG